MGSQMGRQSSPALDETGKAVFDDIYNARDPRPYYRAMSRLGYEIPEQAKPHFSDLFDAYRSAHPGCGTLNVLDIGTSYGVNAALLKWDMPLLDLYAHYDSAGQGSVSCERLLDRDQDYFANSDNSDELQITGLDVASNALEYAVRSGLIDHGISVDLENDDADERQSALIAAADCVISTGCIGYVTDTSLSKILRICSPHRPWMAHCILRMFSLQPYVELLRAHDYEVWLGDELLPQRRFASDEEQAEVVRQLQDLAIDPAGCEADGRLFARMLYAVPREQRSFIWRPGLGNEKGAAVG